MEAIPASRPFTDVVYTQQDHAVRLFIDHHHVEPQVSEVPEGGLTEPFPSVGHRPRDFETVIHTSATAHPAKAALQKHRTGVVRKSFPIELASSHNGGFAWQWLPVPVDDRLRDRHTGAG